MSAHPQIAIAHYVENCIVKITVENIDENAIE